MSPQQVAAATERRAQAAARKAERVSRRERLHLLRLDNPRATRADLRRLLHSIARDRRDGV